MERNAASSRLAALIRDVRRVSRPGVVFADLSPLLADPASSAEVVGMMAAPYLDQGVAANALPGAGQAGRLNTRSTQEPPCRQSR